MGRKHCLAGELWLDHQLLRTMEGASSPKQKVSEIFDLLQHPVYRYLFRLLGDPGEAEDLEQECFLRLVHLSSQELRGEKCASLDFPCSP